MKRASLLNKWPFCRCPWGTIALLFFGSTCLGTEPTKAVVAFGRQAGAEKFLSVANFSNRAVTARLELPAGAAAPSRPLLSRGAEAVVADGKFPLHLDGFGYLVGQQ